MNELFELAGHRYRIGQLDVFQQGHLASRFLNAFQQQAARMAAAMSPEERAQQQAEALAAARAQAETQDETPSTVRPPDNTGLTDDELRPILRQAMMSMSDTDRDFVFRRTLGIVTRLDENAAGKPSAILAPGGVMQLMYQDIDFDQLMQIAVEVAVRILGSFFRGGTPAG